VEYVPVDDLAVFNTIKSRGAPEWVAHMIVKLFQSYRSNSAALVAGDFQILTGKAPRSVEQYFIDHKEAF